MVTVASKRAPPNVVCCSIPYSIFQQLLLSYALTGRRPPSALSSVIRCCLLACSLTDFFMANASKSIGEIADSLLNKRKTEFLLQAAGRVYEEVSFLSLFIGMCSK